MTWIDVLALAMVLVTAIICIATWAGVRKYQTEAFKEMQEMSYDQSKLAHAAFMANIESLGQDRPER